MIRCRLAPRSFVAVVLVAVTALAVGCAVTSPSGPGTADLTTFPTLVSVPHGTFAMGYGAANIPTGPAHTVIISRDFAIGKYEVTNAEYCAALNYALAHGMLGGSYAENVTVTNRNGAVYELLKLDGSVAGQHCEISYDRTRRLFVVETDKERRPVSFVTWYGGAFYCNVLSIAQGGTPWYNTSAPDWPLIAAPGTPQVGYRLPTEAEWEYAGRYDDGRSFPWGSQAGDATFANYNGSVGHASDVGTFPKGASKLGIMDLSGNVSEWCQDFFSSYNVLIEHYTGVNPSQDPTAEIPTLTDPVNDFSGVYLQRRGGGWLTYANNYLWLVYHTDTNYGYIWYPDLGFRVVKTQ